MSHDPPTGKAPEVAPLPVERLEAEFRSPPPEIVEAYSNLSDDLATGTDQWLNVPGMTGWTPMVCAYSISNDE